MYRSYFSSDGAEFNLVRIPIGGTDFSTRGYTYDDGSEDIALTRFTLAPEDYDYKVFFMFVKKILISVVQH